MPNEPEFVSVREVGSTIQAEWLAGALRNEGVDAYVREDLGGGADPFQVARHAAGGGVRVLVRAASLEAALGILEKLIPPQGEA